MWADLLAFVAGVGVTMLAAALKWPERAPGVVELGEQYQEGWDDAVAKMRPLQEDLPAGPDSYEASGLALGAPVLPAGPGEPGSARTAVIDRDDQWAGTLHEMNEQLHAEAEQDDPGWCIACGETTHYLWQCPLEPRGLALLPADPVERQEMLGWGLRRAWEDDGWRLLDEMAAA
jgi:hypothetical protein